MYQGSAPVYDHGRELDQQDERVDKQEEEGHGLVGYFVGVIDVYLEGQQDNDPHNVDEKHATHN